MAQHTAGHSASREHARRRTRARVTAGVLVTVVVAASWIWAEVTWPGAGPVAAAVVAMVLLLPARRWLARRRFRANAWRVGARWEQVTAAWLRRLPARRFVVLHDRAIPGTQANVDHVVIARSGVYTVETKVGRGRVRHRFGRLTIDGVARPDVVEQAAWQASVVMQLLDTDEVAVTPLVCVHGATLPRRRIRVDGVHLVDGPGLVRLLRRRPKAMAAGEVKQVARRLGDLLPPA